MNNEKLAMANKAWELSAELKGISAVLTGISNQLNPVESDTLTPTALYDAIYAIRHHLERIATDLDNIGA